MAAGLGAAREEARAPLYPGRSPYPMLPMEECVETVAQLTGEPLAPVLAPLQEALGRVLAQDVAALRPLPPFPASIMDGFAVRSADGAGRFPVDEVAGGTAGGPELGPLKDGHVRYITTGAPLPPGADAVVKVEDSDQFWEQDRLLVDIKVSSRPFANVRRVGSDTPQGEVVLRRGARVGAGEVGALAALGLAEVEVYPRARLAILSTGDELVDLAAGAARDERRGQIVDCNRPMLRALAAEAGAEPVDLGICGDEPGALRERLAAALRSADVVVTSGGVSRGSKDHMKALLAELGQVHFGEMCMKPGKPTTFATVPLAADGPGAAEGPGRPRLVFALPGNPVSCFVTFKLLVAPAIQRLQGWPAGAPLYPRVDAELAQDVEMDPQRPEYHRAVARWDGGRVLAESTGFQRSSRVASVCGANCLLEIPSQKGSLARGTVVKALLLPGAGGGCLAAGPPPGGVAAPTAPPPAAPAASDAPSPNAPLAPAALLVGLLAVGPGGAALLAGARGGLLGAGVPGGSLAEREVDGADGSLRAALEEWSDDSDASRPPRRLILVLGGGGLGGRAAAAAQAVRGALHRDAPGVADALLREGLRQSPLAMLEEPVAGLRRRSLVACVPGPAAAGCAAVLLPLVRHLPQ